VLKKRQPTQVPLQIFDAKFMPVDTTITSWWFLPAREFEIHGYSTKLVQLQARANQIDRGDYKY
jgi:hypothetical protein